MLCHTNLQSVNREIYMQVEVKYGYCSLCHPYVPVYTKYEGPAKSFVTGFGLLQCYVLSNIFFFITNLQSIPPLLKHIFVTFLPSREKQINSLFLVSVGDTDK